jgi:hypothetical protein
MEMISDKQIIFTPIGPYLMQDNDNPEDHHSAWYPSDFPGWACLVFPEYHPTLEVGAFFAWRCKDIKEDYERVYLELVKKPWVKEFQLQHDGK